MNEKRRKKKQHKPTTNEHFKWSIENLNVFPLVVLSLSLPRAVGCVTGQRMITGCHNGAKNSISGRCADAFYGDISVNCKLPTYSYQLISIVITRCNASAGLHDPASSSPFVMGKYKKKSFSYYLSRLAARLTTRGQSISIIEQISSSIHVVIYRTILVASAKQRTATELNLHETRSANRKVKSEQCVCKSSPKSGKSSDGSESFALKYFLVVTNFTALNRSA